MTMSPFVYAAEAAFQVNRRFKPFGKVKNGIYCSWAPLITTFATQGDKKQLQAAFYSTVTNFLLPVTRGAQPFLLLPVSRGVQLLLLLHFHVSTVHVNSGEMEEEEGE